MAVRLQFIQRNDQIFFVRKSWTDEERRVFVALQLGRWLHSGVLEFADVVRVASELEDIFAAYVNEFGNQSAPSSTSSGAAPADLYFLTPFRELYVRPHRILDPDVKALYNVYINVALRPEAVQALADKFEQFARLDRSSPPRDKCTLSQSAVYRELDFSRFRQMEQAVLGAQNAADYETMQFCADRRRNMLMCVRGRSTYF